VKLTVNGENVARCTPYFRCSTTLMLLRHLVSLVSNGVAKLVFQNEVVHVKCLYCKGWKSHRILS